MWQSLAQVAIVLRDGFSIREAGEVPFAHYLLLRRKMHTSAQSVSAPGSRLGAASVRPLVLRDTEPLEVARAVKQAMEVRTS